MITTILENAIEALNNEDIVAIPTETVYGLAGNAFSENAIKKIYALKNRPDNNPLIVHIKSVEYLNEVAIDIPPIAYKLASSFWPGPLTLILQKNKNVPDIVTSGKATVAVRIPNHHLTNNLLNNLDFPLAAPSANPFGSISPTNANHVFNYFKNEINFILDGGECSAGIESTIIGFADNQPILYRHGAVSIEDLEIVTNGVKIIEHTNQEIVAPGMFAKHYAPRTNTFLTNQISELIKIFPNKKIGLLLLKKTIENKSILHQEILSEKGNLSEAAKNLYAALHRLDNLNLEIIIAEKMPNIGIGISINDRLTRATKK